MRVVFLFWIAFLLWACGKSESFSEKDGSSIFVQIHAVTEDHFGSEPSAVGQSRVISVPLDGALEFWAIPFVDSSAISQEEADTLGYFRSPLWEIEGTTISEFAVRYRFSNPGIDTVRFFALDVFGDTLQDSIIVYVDAPLRLRVHSPQPITLDFNPSTANGIQFEWSLQGVDPWEYPWVILYLTDDSLSLLNDYHATSSTGSLFVPTENLCPPDSNCRLWWRVVAVTSTYKTGAPIRADSSAIFTLQTRRTDTDQSRAVLQLFAPGLELSASLWAKSHLASDSIEIAWSIDTLTGKISSPLLQPGRWIIEIGDSLHPEYSTDSIAITLDPGVLYNIGNTVKFQDKVAPQVMPLLSAESMYSTTYDTAWFEIFDYGSGVDSSATKVEWTGLKPILQDQKIGIPWISLTSQDKAGGIKITTADLAGNKSAECSWAIQSVSTYAIKLIGPDCSMPDSSSEKQ